MKNHWTIGEGDYLGFNYTGTRPIIRAYDAKGVPLNGVRIDMNPLYGGLGIILHDSLSLIYTHILDSCTRGDGSTLTGAACLRIQHDPYGTPGIYEIEISGSTDSLQFAKDTLVFYVIKDSEQTNLPSGYTHETDSWTWDGQTNEIPGDGLEDYQWEDSNSSRKNLLIELDYQDVFQPDLIDRIKYCIDTIMETADIEVNFKGGGPAMISIYDTYYFDDVRSILSQVRDDTSCLHIMILNAYLCKDMFDTNTIYHGATFKQKPYGSGFNIKYLNSEHNDSRRAQLDSLGISVQARSIIDYIDTAHNWQNWIDTAHAIAAVCCNEIGHALGLRDDISYAEGVMKDWEFEDILEGYAQHSYYYGPHLNYVPRRWLKRGCAVNLRYTLGIHTVNPEY